MQLDSTSIAIRERTLLDTLDLSLHVVRVYAVPLAVTLAMGVVPLMLINYFLFGWMSDIPDLDTNFPFRFVWHMTAQIFLQAPLASVFATCFLGRIVFLERPRYSEVARGVAKAWLPLLLCQLLQRGVGAGWLLELANERTPEFEPFLEGFLLVVLILYAAFMRAFRPFINEVVLLEHNPLRGRKNSRAPSIGRRSAMLHGASSGELFSRSLGSSLIGLGLIFACYGVFLFGAGVFFNDWSQSRWMVQLFLPLSMWIVAGYLAVFRFLSYLDVRIRQEGWEVELQLRAESARWRAGLRA